MSTRTETGTADVTPAILTARPVDAAVGITTKEELRNHLIQAAAVEMQTIPMYLYAAFSIAGKGDSRWAPGISAQRLIRSVVIEEMLHLCLVRNILVAVGYGDEIRFHDEDFLPAYPEYMLHRYPPLLLKLGRCTRELVNDVFVAFERPDPSPGEGRPPHGQYSTIGRFYTALAKGLKKLDDQSGTRLWQNNQPQLQYVSAYWNKDGGGEPLLVKDLETAQKAIALIKDQGEGSAPGHSTVPIDPLNPKPGLDELPHYTKFKRIAEGIAPIGPVWTVPNNPTSGKYEDDKAAVAINGLFNATYCYVLHLIDVLYQTPDTDVSPGATSTRWERERLFISAMQGLLATTAESMVAQPFRTGPLAESGLQMAPTFEYVAPPNTPWKQHLIRLCDDAIVYFPELGGDNSARWLLDKMPDDI